MTNPVDAKAKDQFEPLQKFLGGSNYVEWLERLKKDMAESSVEKIKYFGPDLLKKPPVSSLEYSRRWEEANPMDQKIIEKMNSDQVLACGMIWNVILSRLSHEVEELLRVEPEFQVMESNHTVRNPFALLNVLKRVVTTGVTSDPFYQTIINTRKLHDLKQGQNESVRDYVDRAKVLKEAFMTTSPHGLYIVCPTYTVMLEPWKAIAAMPRKERKAILSGELNMPEKSSHRIGPSDLVENTPERGWINEGYMVRLAILGLNEKHEDIKAEWKRRMLDAKGGGKTIPDSLEEFVGMVSQHVSMNGDLSQDISVVNATRMANGGKSAARDRRGTSGEAARKRKSPEGEKLVCFNCQQEGHYASKCPTKRKGSAKENKPGSEVQEEKRVPGGPRQKSAPSGPPEVKVTELSEFQDWEDDFVDPRDQFRVDATRIASKRKIEDAPSGGHAEDYRILFDNCANGSIIRNP